MKFLRWMDHHLEVTIMAMLLVVIVLLTFTQIAMRAVIGTGILWSEEISKYALVVSGFVSVAYGIRHGTMIRVDAFISLIGRKPRLVLKYVVYALLLGFFVLFTYKAFGVMQTMKDAGTLMSIAQIPVWFIYLFVSLGFLNGLIRVVQVLVLDYLSFRKNGRMPDTFVSEAERDAREALESMRDEMSQQEGGQEQ